MSGINARTEYELNAGGEPVKNATYWKRQYNALLMKLNISAIKISELEKDLALKTRDRDVFRDFTLAYEKRIEELEKHLKKVQWALAQQVDILGEMGWHQVNKDGYTTPQTKPLSEAIQVVEQLRVDADLNYKDYENTYADGWDDAFNEILSALYKKDGIK